MRAWLPAHSTTPENPPTKGDNDNADDMELCARNQFGRDTKVVGSVVGYVPFVGYVTIMLSEHPWMKTAMLGFMGSMVVLQRAQ